MNGLHLMNMSFIKYILLCLVLMVSLVFIAGMNISGVSSEIYFAYSNEECKWYGHSTLDAKSPREIFSYSDILIHGYDNWRKLPLQSFVMVMANPNFG